MKQYNFNGTLLREYGVYIRTLLNSNTQINGVGSGVVGLVGLAERGESDQPVIINSFKELVETFGDGPIVRHGLAIFSGGASQIVAVRIGNPLSASLAATSVGAAAAKSYTVRAIEKGTYGNNISFGVRVGNVADNTTAATTADEQVAKRLSENNDFYEVLVRYTDRTGQDLRERFIFPRFIPSVEVKLPDGTIGKRFFNDNTGYYFMLKDRETGVVREVPEVWTYGAVTAADFLGRVDELKSVNEDLLTFPVMNGADRNFFPMAVVSHVINNGGFGYNPSLFVRIEDMDVTLDDLSPTDTNGTTNLIEVDADFLSSTREELIVHEPVALAGGFNGDDGTSFYAKGFSFDGAAETVVNYEPTLGMTAAGTPNTDAAAEEARAEWIRGFGLLENFDEVNFVQPAYLFNPKAGSTGKGTTWKQRIGFFKSIVPLILAHVEVMSGTKARKFRTTVLGLPWYKSAENARKSDMDFMNDSDVKEISGLLNDDRAQLWVGGFKSRALSTKLENYGAEMLASFAVGLHSSKEVPDSLTFQQISGIFTDGLEFYWTTQSISEIYARSFNAILRRTTMTGATQYIASSNVTSWTGSESRGIPQFIVRRTVDYMNTFIYKNLEENFIGTRAGGEETVANLTRYVESLLQRLINERILVKAQNVVVEPVIGANNAYTISFDFRPYNEVDFIFVTNSLRWDI